MDIKTLFLSRLSGFEFYYRFRKLQNEATIDINTANNNGNTPIASKEAVSIRMENEENMADVYAYERRVHTNVLKMKDIEEEYEEEMRNNVEE